MIRPKHILYLSLILFLSCKSEMKNVVNKFSDNDYFKNSIVESQFFKINSSADNVIESKKGNVLIIPKGSLLDNDGKVIEDSVQIEFAEASEIDEVILSNLMIQDSSKVFESYLSFFLKATQREKQLIINPENPIYFELSADKQVNLYKGVRDKEGNMNWNKVLSPVNYLIPVPFENLDFYPPGFENEVERGLPFRGHEIATVVLLDSLYYSFATEVNKTESLVYSNSLKMINFITPLIRLIEQEDSQGDKEYSDSSVTICGINPASIKAIRDKKFQNTLISTREFETRLKTIFATCDNRILELYITNLNKNLWEIDEMAAKLLGPTHKKYSKFLEFVSYKQSNVRVSDKNAELLAQYYQENKAKIEQELLKMKQDFLDKRKKHEEIVQEKRDKYQALLEKRHEYRMQKFGFELSDFGWYNAAREIKLNEVEKFDLNITITNGFKYDRVYAYVINPKIKSIFSYLSEDKSRFNIVYSEDPDLLLWKNQEFNIIGVGYNENNIGYKIEKYIQQPTVDVKIELDDTKPIKFKEELKTFSRGYKQENKILVDLEYQTFFYEEMQRQEKEKDELRFLWNLAEKIFPCCYGDYDPEILAPLIQE
jgi:hypothetical protein